RRHARLVSDWSSDVCSSDLHHPACPLVLGWSARAGAPAPDGAPGGARGGGRVRLRARGGVAGTQPAGAVDAAVESGGRRPGGTRSEERRGGKGWRGREGPYG